MAEIKLKGTPVIKMPPGRANQNLAFGKKYLFGAILGVPSSFTAPHSNAVADLWSATNPIPVGIVTAFEGIDLTKATANTVSVIGVGNTEMDYNESVKVNPYLATVPGVMNAPLDQRFTNILITKRKEL